MKPSQLFIALSWLAATVGSHAAEPGPATPAAAKPAAAAPADAKPAAAAHAPAKDPVALDATQITGNRELPRVLYVVPWKRADLGDVSGKPARSLLDEVLAPVDRDVFRRQMRYHDALQPDSGVATAAPVAGDEPKVER